jgi:hypothetical protein
LPSSRVERSKTRERGQYQAPGFRCAQSGLRLLRLLDFIFARGGDWALKSLLAVGASWVAGPLALYAASRFEKPAKRNTA